MKIIKLGGGMDIDLDAFARDLAGHDGPMVIVHGANGLRNHIAEKLNAPIRTVTSLSGYQSVLTDDETIDLMLMTYAGLRNKRLVEICRRHGINAVGLTGVDAGLVIGRRNRGIKTKVNDKKVIMRDLSGKPQAVNTPFLHLLLDNGYVPIICPPILDENLQAINTENDDVVALLARELRAKAVVQLIEAPGLLADHGDEDSLIRRLPGDELQQWERRVEGRMKRKLMALRKVADNQISTTYIADGRMDRPVSRALNGEGTVISPNLPNAVSA